MSPLNAQGLRGSTGMSAPKGYEYNQNYTPQQMKLFEDAFAHASPDSMTGRLAAGDQSQFDALEAPALRQFGALQGNIASRFSGQGLGGRKGSGFQNTMSAASSNFAQDLQSQRMGLQRQAIQDLMGMSDNLLGKKPFSLIQKQKPWWQQLLMKFGESAAESAGNSIFMRGKEGGGGGQGNEGQALAALAAALGGGG